MKDNERCLTALRDNSDSQTQRALQESKIRSEQKHLKSRKIKRDGIEECQLSEPGTPLEPDAHAHHEVRRADDPDLALDLDNIKIANKEAHKQHHKEEKKIDFE